MDFLTILVCFLASMGAGLGTGFAGLSAAAVITPVLTTFLHIDTYTAVGIALASDVLASAVSAYTYKKNDNLDIKNGLIILIAVLVIIAGSASVYIIKQKKRGARCIGCPSAKTCGSQAHCTGGCGCNCQNK